MSAEYENISSFCFLSSQMQELRTKNKMFRMCCVNVQGLN